MKKTKKVGEETTRVILNVPTDIDNVYKLLAKKRGLTKTNMIIYSMSWFLDYSKSLDLLPKMLETLNKVNDL